MVDTRSYPQPREGVTGIDRSDNYLLSLDMAAVAHRDALIALAQNLRTATMVGNPAPVVARMVDRLRSPRVGDLVVEESVGVRTRDPELRSKALGILVEKRIEWWETDEDWAAALASDDSLTEDDRMTDEAWYIQYGPNPEDICRWVNCSFLAIPIDGETFATAFGTMTATGITIDRDAVLAGLADSGFNLQMGDRS